MYYTFDAVKQLVYHFSSQTINFQEWTFLILFSRKNSFMLLAPWCILWFLCERQTFMPVIILWHRVLCQQYIDKIYFGAQSCLALYTVVHSIFLKCIFNYMANIIFRTNIVWLTLQIRIFVHWFPYIYQTNKNISLNEIME